MTTLSQPDGGIAPGRPQEPSSMPRRARPAQDRVSVRKRDALVATESWTRQGRVWVLADPMVREYHYLLDDEYLLLRMLDGESTFDSIRERFERGDARRRLDRRRFDRLVSQWHRDGLVESRVPGQAGVLFGQRERARRARWSQFLSNPLVIRLPGFDPRRLLKWAEPMMGWLFHPFALVMAGLLICVAAVMTISRFDDLIEGLPTPEAFSQPATLGVMLVVTAGVKALHELAHAVACKRFGAEPKEIGLLFFIFTPCLYCDVSDAWRLPKVTHRLAISAAGMYLEMVLAAVATILWFHTQSGLLNQICLVVMVIGSVNTLFINGNPLLRYDGYYLLSDYLGIVNLWQRSRIRVANALTDLFTGARRRDETGDDRFVSSFLLGYGLASIVYRWFVLAVMLMFLYRLLEPLGIQWVAIAVGGWVIGGSMFKPFYSWSRNLMGLARKDVGVRRRAGLLTFVAVSILIGALFLPLPNRVRVAAVLRPVDATDIFVSVPGTLKSIRSRPGQNVRAGEVIAELSSPVLELQGLRLEGEIRRADAWLEHLEARGATDPQSRSLLPAAKAKRDDLVGQLGEIRADLARLVLKAPAEGRVWPGPRAIDRRDQDGLVGWTGLPLDARNVGAFMPTGTKVGTVGSADAWQAFLYVSQAEVDDLRPGLVVRVKPVHLPGVVVEGVIQRIAKVNADSVPPQLADSIDVDLGRGPKKDATLPSRVFQVQVSIPQPAENLIIDGRGDATIWLDRRTLWEMISRSVAKTFVM
jgi:putative peptide zinc metalloprotease protein